MKTKIIFLTLVIFILSFSLVQGAGITAPNLQVTLLSQSPDPVEPGQVVKVKFKIENLGKESTVDTLVKIVPQFPFSLYNGEAEKNIGKLRSDQTGADAAIVEFNLKVDENAIEDETELELMVKIDQDVWVSYTNSEFLIDIQTHDAVLDITSTTSDPEQIAPGSNAEITLQVKNLADSLLKDIKFALDFEDDDLPLAPYQSSSERRLSQLQSGFQKPLTFQVIADPDATPGLYKIPLTITYNDEKGTSYSLSEILAVLIGEKPKINTYIKKSTVLQANQEGIITLEIANTGTTDIKFLELSLLPSEDYQLVSTSDYYYIGDVDSDDTESEEIDIFINRKAETLKFPIKLKYSDANNNQYQQQVNLELNLYSTSQLKKFGVIQSSYGWLYLLLIILAVGGYFFYKYYYRKNKKNK